METIKVSGYPVSLLQQLKLLHTEGRLCDVSLRVEDGQVSAHRLVLMAASPYFEAKLSRQLSDEEAIVQLEDVQVDVVEAVVQFMYSGELVFNSGNIQTLLNFCEMLQLTSVVNAYKKSLLNKTVQAQGDANLVNDVEEKVPDTTYESEDQQTVTKKLERRTVKRPIQILDDDEADLVIKSQVKKKRSVGVAKEKKIEPIKKQSGGGKRKQLKPRKVSKADVKDSIPEENTGARKRKTKVSKALRNKTKNDKDYDEDENLKDVYTDNVKDESIDNFDGDTDMETNTETVTANNKTIKPVKRRKRKLEGDETGPVKRVYKRRTQRFPCSMCDKVLSNHKRLVFHQFSKHGNPYDEDKYSMVPCKEEGCTYVAANRHNMDTHLKSRHGQDRPHICEFCGKGFKLPNVLATHLNIHTGRKTWKCDTCGEAFNQQSGLMVHIKRHHMGESSWGELCHLCSEKFLQKSELAWHLFKAHNQTLPDRYKVYICYICNYLTKSAQDLKRHQNAHEGIKQFTCSTCQKSCSTKSELKRHVSFHGEKKYKCTFAGCSYACTDSIGLGKHIKLMHTHKNYKPYICSVCPYRTGVKGNLDKHIRQVHNLVVVTKHTIPLKMKYSTFESGDIITQDGRLIATAKERKELQDQYRAENPDGIDRGLDYDPDISLLIPPSKKSDDSALTSNKVDKNIENYIAQDDKIIPVHFSHSESEDRKNNFMHSTGGNGDDSNARELTPLANYVYLEGSPPISSSAMSAGAEDLRVSMANQVTSAPSGYRTPAIDSM